MTRSSGFLGLPAPARFWVLERLLQQQFVCLSGKSCALRESDSACERVRKSPHTENHNVLASAASCHDRLRRGA
eukprot:scaffold71_cov247-Pinguiococcus_pyrenoidosus.AAC.27